ncbi:7873_t:CDS:2 [Ambispora gerdemannii]|uniref:7873_t:CDS:1 n=1 Tax=Ambispora gerdemannii TaxID=144530 RepID=A0A9N9AEB2_9GLOM|nr:7873_t:CDS:2 [Ambispora gerdemannii]
MGDLVAGSRLNIRQSRRVIYVLEGLVSGRLVGLEHRQARRVTCAPTLALWLGS